MTQQILLSPSSETIKKVREELGLDERRTKEAVEGLKKWLEMQPHLPDEGEANKSLYNTVVSIQHTMYSL